MKVTRSHRQPAIFAIAFHTVSVLAVQERGDAARTAWAQFWGQFCEEIAAERLVTL
jgi:hypothetical protein